MSEVYYPDLGTPSVRDLDFVVTDGHGLVQRVTSTSATVARQVGARSLTYQLTDTETHHRWRLSTTYVTDPARATVLIKLRFASLDGRRYRLYLLYEPALGNNGNDNSGYTRHGALVATGNGLASALTARTGFTETSNGYLGTSDGWTDLQAHGRMAWHYSSATDGDVVQTARLPLTGLPGHATDTLSLGFATSAAAALTGSRASLQTGFGAVARRYAASWHGYLATLRRPPASLRGARQRRLYTVSEMVLAALEDKTYRGALVASPTMPWAWGTGLSTPTGAYHLVWARDARRDGHRAHRRRGPRRRGAGPGVPVPLPAGGERFLPGQLHAAGPAGLHGPRAGRGSVPHPARLPARPDRRGGLAARRAGRQLPAQLRLRRLPGALEPGGALGEPERLLARHHRRRDRRPGLRRPDRERPTGRPRSPATTWPWPTNGSARSSRGR